ncbi:LPS assembly protein LptD [Agrobacterium vitis]|uniref:LPS-assembly protein LptD n=1 Tax=Rhizobium/Agrobacterium group TaxID=227290 RepID=UPI0008DBF3FF|nr:LPS-assembly protein LptD [Agrobacterium vitis]MCF1434345.1 LPS-assembly protein LptD [Allorhizobium ampelinum]MUO89503.1 LPS assembly protein LptD [Agrobacterium vitis]MUZ51645.1 LPS assembly protein LptD [Agrobacterium vitis]MUZ90138.1 LPS assembly protein LptD [Agrobacterium vitis]MVA39247.1 LPS assembly protein LptD [Agrobacterium vitis]
MAAIDRGNIKRLFTALLAGVAFSATLVPVPFAYAQTASSNGLVSPKIPADAKLMLAANEMTYDKDAQKVTAVGGVQINYAGYQMVSKRVEYDQKTGRMMAYGNIELIEPDGNRIYADKMDVTDDFANGFVNSLRVETTDNTRIAAQKGERVNGDQMILYKGVYTACLPCAEQGRAPFWQIKAERVIQNGKTHTIRLENARFQLFGKSIALIPSIEVPDNTVKRKSGFLFPEFSTTQKLGFGVIVPYYWAISPQTDATIKLGGFTSQGVLIDTEVRHQFEDGLATLRFAGIDQLNPGKFDSGTTDAEKDFRGMVGSTGKFDINPRWSFGWDVMLESDNNFARTYDLEGFNQKTHTNQVYLTGLGDRNSFDMRAYYFDIQDADSKDVAERKQPIVTPTIDYSYYAPEPFMGGELSATVNFTALTRYNSDILNLNNGNERFSGLKGNTTRLTGEVEWKRTFDTPQGVLLTPILAARGDAFGNNMDAPGSSYSGNYNDTTGVTRSMVTAGLEVRYPWLLSAPGSTHVIEPIGQIFVRPDEQQAGRLTNEDAQSFVFDASNLFERDKFSGYDRVEGGTRANVGLRYTGSFDSGYTLRSIFGQSYQLAGKNSFASSDLVYAGNESGLETAVSDYVGMVGLDTPYGISTSVNARFDEKTFEVARTDSAIGYHNDQLQTNFIYTQIAAQPNYGYDYDREEIQNASSVKIGDFWSVFGSITWDVKKDNINRYGIGVSYADDCTIFSIVYKNKDDDESANDWSIGARLTFRTLGDVKVGDTDVTGFN